MKGITKYGIGCLVVLCVSFLLGQKAYAAEAEPVIVVLDPGHGGENLGAEYEEYTEKEMTMIVADAMKEELEKYEGIKVYMTREGDEELSLEERAEYAKSVNADFLFCLHFNMSEKHNLFGAEVWVSAFGERYKQSYEFAVAEMELLEELGLYSRGIKTRLNDEGEDYYGILRHATERDLNAALIEHCHLDQANDKQFYTSEEKLRQFGILDATAVAQYYGLRSEVLGVDYSNYQKQEIPEPTAPVKPDLSEPDVCVIEVDKVEQDTGDVTVSVIAEDYDSCILYYSYSYDGGENFSDLERWEPEGMDCLTFTMQVPSGTLPEIVVNVYNAYDRITESNHISLPSIVYEKQDEAIEAGSMQVQNQTTQAAKEAQTKIDGHGEDASLEGYTEVSYETFEEEAPSITVLYFVKVSLICVGILFVLFLVARLLTGGRYASSKKKRRRKK